MNIFISCSSTDLDFARTLKEKLAAWGYQPWLYEDGIPPGSRWPDEIDRALKKSDLILGVISPKAVDSRNVKNEWDWAIENEKDLWLLRLKPCILPHRYVSINFLDFQSDIEQGFNKLNERLAEKSRLASSVSLSPDVRYHVEKYWRLCRQFYYDEDYALAAFFAITLVEEAGMSFELGLYNMDRTKEFQETMARRGKDFSIPEKPRKPMRNPSTQEKLYWAVEFTLIINARVQRLYGFEDDTFAFWYRERHLERIRKRALHLLVESPGTLSVPAEQISRKEAYILVVMGGEIYAEMQSLFVGVGPDEWRRVLNEVEEFRKANQPLFEDEG